jgi:hypothetical protein
MQRRHPGRWDDRGRLRRLGHPLGAFRSATAAHDAGMKRLCNAAPDTKVSVG